MGSAKVVSARVWGILALTKTNVRSKLTREYFIILASVQAGISHDFHSTHMNHKNKRKTIQANES
jgi:hypothetical protein